jgi:nucleotide-binding universal stress UspA family protein
VPHDRGAKLEGSTSQQRRIVVGVDGSPESDRALDWAISEAKQHDAVLEILTAWMFPMSIGYAFTTTVAEVRQSAQTVVDRAITRVTEVAPEVVVHGEPTEQPPAPALVRASKGADLLVVGSRGAGGFKGLLLGSVSQYCVRHACCPVAVIRCR